MGDMETKQTKWEELSISNDFLFGKVMQNPELCKELLQRILPDLNIERIEYPELQKSINMDMDARSVRLDVYVKDEKEVVYDIEMQVSHTKELPKRSRYYQSIYTFANICKEDGSISMGDEAVKIFLNAKGTLDDVSDELKAFLDYVAGKKPKNAYVERLEEAVKEAKKNREWRHEYMTLLMRDQENVKIGEEKMLLLIERLIEDKRFDDIARIKADNGYRQKLYLEYHII